MVSIVLGLILACGTERWDIKTLIDTTAEHLQTNPVQATVHGLSEAKAPHWEANLPRQGAELQVYVVEALVTGFKLEGDGDFHVVLRDESGATMIIEFPAPDCAEKSPYVRQMVAARREFLALFGHPNAKFKTLKKPIKARVTGPMYFDRLHGQDGVAPNGVEIHPVLSIQKIQESFLKISSVSINL